MNKQMKRIVATLSVMMFTMLVAHAGTDKSIRFNQLPQQAQQTVNQHFKDKKVAIVKKETDWISKSYDVIFTDGGKVEFDKNGNWTEVDCKPHAVPAFFVPAQIKTFVKTNYPNTKVSKIEKVRSGYEVELSNNVEITFDSKFQVVDVDR